MKLEQGHGGQSGCGASVDRVPWVRPIFDVDDALVDELRVALSTGRVTNDGPYLRRLEREFAAYLGADDCVVVSSGSDALFLSVWALGLQGAKAVLPSFTFISTLNAIFHCGLTPVFCDIDPATWTLSAPALARLLKADPGIRLVVPVNVFGAPPDLAGLQRAVDGTDAVILLDNAHGVGTEHEGLRYSQEPRVQTYSFHATKILPAVEGGAVVSADPALLAAVRRFRNHGFAADLLASTPGYNSKMSELHAAVGLRSLRNMETTLERRRQYAERLRRVLSSSDCAGTFTVQGIPASTRSNFQNLGVLCRHRNRADAPAIAAELEREGIETRRYFWPALHDLPAYRGQFDLPVTDQVAQSILCLPLYSYMEPPVLDRIEAAVRRVAQRCA